ncbi:Glycosyltransferase PglI [Rhodococcus wratislaviensis]|uniref:Glycosyltransferase PglI n=1 Tax=Rhodococcus wratislaviensis TaxID=44752 RepID=A0A402BYH4_RHOWR|nr:glycosyltransferase family 2 protein [Rhodococcus wratislaviensis]GCE36406.1 Glycosyltransferase PglI [Rhodococcus wratislaviensis]
MILASSRVRHLAARSILATARGASEVTAAHRQARKLEHTVSRSMISGAGARLQMPLPRLQVRGNSLPKVSVCIPVYDSADTVERCIDSVMSQSFRDFECVVVDNHSSDSTLAKVSRFRDGRLKVVRNEFNIGLVGNHNKCVRLAQGELIQFVHGDDWLLPHCLERLVPTFEVGNVGLAFAPRRVDTDDDVWKARYGRLHTPLEPLGPINDGRDIVKMFVLAGAEGNWIGEPTSVMFRRDLLVEVGGFRPQLPRLQDIDAWLRLLARSDAAWIDEALSVRWHHSNTYTAQHETTGAASLDHLWLLSGLARNTDLAGAVRVRASGLWTRAILGNSRAILSGPRALRVTRFRQLVAHVRVAGAWSTPEKAFRPDGEQARGLAGRDTESDTST